MSIRKLTTDLYRVYSIINPYDIDEDIDIKANLLNFKNFMKKDKEQIKMFIDDLEEDGDDFELKRSVLKRLYKLLED